MKILSVKYQPFFGIINWKLIVLSSKLFIKFWLCDQRFIKLSVSDHGNLDSITVYPKKYAHGFYFAVLCCGYTLTDFSHIHQAYFTGTVAI